jgi:predicted ester cyclase
VVTAEEGDELVLVAEWTMRGTHSGPFDGLPPTGNEIELDGVDVVTVSDDGITSITGYFDQRAFVEQLGLTFPTVVGQLPTLAVGAVRHRLS